MTSTATPFKAPWHGLPKAGGSCTVTAFSQGYLDLRDSLVIEPCEEDVRVRRPVITFLIQHESGKTALFDLGIGGVWRESVPEENWSAYEEEFRPEIREELAEVLERRKGIKGSDVDVAIVSHQHWDHTGTPSTFPNAKVYLGPNELEHIPTLHSHPSVHVINWDSTLHPPIATFSHSYDVWSDGSLLIVPTPGHTPGHLGALVRSTPPNSTTEEYLLLAGDSCHHTKLLSHHIPQNNAYHLPAGFYEDVAEAERTRDRIKSADRREEVMLVVAHNQEQWKRWNGGDEGVELSGWRERGLKFVE